MRVTQLAITRPVSTVMATIALLLFGLLALERLPVNLLPELTYPTVTIHTRLPEAAPAEVESLLSKRIEEVVGVVNNVVRLSSISRAGQSEVVLEFGWGTNIDLAVLEVRERLDRLRLPVDAETPILLRYDPDLDPIMRLSLSGERDLLALRTLAEETIKRQLEVIDGVAAVQVNGGLEEEIQVEIDEARLARLGISLPQVIERLQQENIDLVGGAIHDGDARYLVRTLNAFTSVADIAALGVGRRNGAPIVLRDVADVRQGQKDRRLITRLNGAETVELALFKRVDGNTVRVAEGVRQRLQALQATLDELPDAVRLQVISDQSTFIRDAIREVLKTAWLGGILAMLVLYLFLHNVRSTLIIGSAIPVSVIGSFFLMYLLDISLNILSLGGLALGIGMLVDNAIVVLESVERQRAPGVTRLQAAWRGTAEVGQAITASTLTTVCVFVPLIFVRGVAGQLFNDLALTVSCALLMSLTVAVTLIPMFAAIGEARAGLDGEEPAGPVVQRLAVGLRALWRGVRRMAAPVVWVLRYVEAAFARALRLGMHGYLRILDWGLRHRAVVLIVVLGVWGGLAALGMQIGQTFMPELHQGVLIADVTLPIGTPLHSTADRVRQIERVALQHPRIVQVYSGIGRQHRGGGVANSERENVAQLHLHLAPQLVADDEARVLADLRRAVRTLPGVRVEFARPSYFSFAMPLEVEIRGHDLGQLRRVAQQWTEVIGGLDGLTDVRSSMAPGEPELQITFDRPKLAALGLDLADVATIIKQNVQGEVATALTRAERDVDIRVRAQPASLKSIAGIERLRINPRSAVPVPLSAVATLVVARGPSEIRHEDLQRVAVITASVQDRALGETVRDLRQQLQQRPLPVGLTARVRGQSAEMLAAFRSLVFALMLATFLVYLVLASQFESFVQPLIILFAIPLGMSGVVLALWLTGQSLNVLVGIGAVLLVGIVVNNAIVLVDYGNQCRQRGLERLQAIREAATVRFRPILMTTSTTVLGLLPMALGLGHGAELRTPLAITVIGGLLVATLLTLLLIPVAYSLVGGRRLRPPSRMVSRDIEHDFKE
ncbi:MAG: efflux RND transporter permease subunit [Candidatus Tectomicrobia bacterium]|nr:efflux RND transporter permease subunit [Candidatus Tectomicrobia bacterium]